MKKWNKIKKSQLIMAVTGVLVIGAGALILANASGLHSMFEPRDFESFENQYVNNGDYNSAAGDGEESDLADENEDGEDTADEGTQKALKAAENDFRDQEEPDSLAMADNRNDGEESEREENPNAFEVSDDKGAGGLEVRPDGRDRESLGGGNLGNPGGDGGGNKPVHTEIPRVTGTLTPTGIPKPTDIVQPTRTPEPKPTDIQAPTNVPDMTNTPQLTQTPRPTNRPGLTEIPSPTNTPYPSNTPYPTETLKPNPDTPTPKPTVWEDEQLKPRDPVETENGTLTGLSAVIHRQYYRGDVFKGEDAVVTAVFRQTDGTKEEIVLNYGGENGYSVNMSTQIVGTHTAAFHYLGFTARAKYEVISSGVAIRYHGEGNGEIFAIYFPGPLGGDAETMEQLSNLDLYPDSGGVVDLSDVHSRMTAYLGDQEIKRKFFEEITHRNVIFLEEKNGYLTTMLSGFQYYSNGNLETGGPYIYYPVYSWGASNLRNVVNVVKAVPEGYKIRRIVHSENNLAEYRGSQVLEQYTGDERSLAVPMGVTDLKLKGEQGEGNITSLILPESVSRIDFASVSECLPELEAYEVLGYSAYQAIDGVLYSKDGQMLISVPAGKKNIIIPDTVTTIASGAFRNSRIRELNIPSTVMKLEADCFDGFQGDVIRIEGTEVPKVILDTGYSGKVLFRNSAYDSLMKRGIFAFKSEKMIFGVMDEMGAEIPEKTGIYQYDRERHILTRKDEAETLAGIPTDLYGRYTIPDGITAVEKYAFAGIDGLRKIELPASVTELREGSLILSRYVENISITAEAADISSRAFGSPQDGAEVPDIVIYVPEKFYASYIAKWSQMLDPVYGEGTAKHLLRADNGTVFYENEAEYQKIAGDGTEYYRLVKLYAQDKTAFAVKEGTEEIEAGAFSLCGPLEILYLPDSLKRVEDGAFTGCKNLQTVTVKESRLLSGDVFDPLCGGVKIYDKASRFIEFCYDNGVVYGKSADGSYILLDVPTDYRENILLYENTRALNEEAFRDCRFLKKISLPDQEALVEIGNRCFENCTAIESVRLDRAVHLEKIGEEAFRFCTGLVELYLPEHLDETGKRMCYDCTALQLVKAEGCQKIGEETFYNCKNLLSKGVLLNWDEMTEIGNGAFAYCSLLTFIPDMPKLEKLGERAFYICQRLRQIVLPETLSGMGEECFGECTSLSQIVMNGKLTGISRYCFYGCRELVKVEFSEQQKSTLQVVGVQAFGQCTSLETLDLRGFPLLRQMGERTFAGCGFLTTVRMPENLSKIPDYCFEGCRNLSILALYSDQAAELGEAVFGEELSPFIHIWVKEERLAGYREVYQEALDQTYGGGTAEKIIGIINEKIEIIRGITFELTKEGRILKEASEAFQGAYAVPMDTVQIESEAFMNCDGLTEVELPAGSSICLGDRCFKGCAALETVQLHGDIPQWGEEAFMNCTSLKKLDIGGGRLEQIPRIGTRAFKGCTGLAGRDEVTFRAVLSVLGEECFAGCENLEAVPMSENARTSIETIEDRAFEGCKNLSQFLTSAFTGVKTIGVCAFSDCDSLANPSIPAGVTWVGDGIFSECDNLKTVSFYCVLEEYPKDCFKNCPKLTRTGGVADALSGLKRIGESAYEGCISLTTNSTWNLVRYSNLEEIGVNAFTGCVNMTDISLSTAVKKIGAGAFDGCSNVIQMIFGASTVPEIGMIALDTLSESFCIKVPDSQPDGDSIYKSYLGVFEGMFGHDTAYEILDSISDGAKERNRPADAAGSRRPDETVSGAGISGNCEELPKGESQSEENKTGRDTEDRNNMEGNEFREIEETIE